MQSKMQVKLANFTGQDIVDCIKTTEDSLVLSLLSPVSPQISLVSGLKVVPIRHASVKAILLDQSSRIDFLIYPLQLQTPIDSAEECLGVFSLPGRPVSRVSALELASVKEECVQTLIDMFLCIAKHLFGHINEHNLLYWRGRFRVLLTDCGDDEEEYIRSFVALLAKVAPTEWQKIKGMISLEDLRAYSKQRTVAL